MIDYIRGALVEKSPGKITVEANGVGYEIAVPLSTYERLPSVNAELKVLTHFQVREDSQRLYGFLSEAERETFRRLIEVNMIGPKVAMSILSGVSVDDLARAVAAGDDTRLRAIPGVGPKTAQRLVVELKGKVKPTGLTAGPAASMTAGVPGNRSEAFEAMLALGYADKQVQAALARVEKVIEQSAPVEEWIRKALQVI